MSRSAGPIQGATARSAPCSLDRIDVAGVPWQKMKGRTSRFDQLTCPFRACGGEVVQMSPGCRCRPRQRTDTGHEAGVLTAPHVVAKLSQRSPHPRRPWSKLSPQLPCRGSISSVPRGRHACARPIARFAPDSTTNTRRRRAPAGYPRVPLGLDGGTSCSAGRGRFFFLKTYSCAAGTEHNRPLDPRRGRGGPAVPASAHQSGRAATNRWRPMIHR
jgi:hypothetical protein